MTARPDMLAPAGGGARPRPGFNPRYSQFVSLAKRILPGIAAILLLLVAVWPRLQDALERVHFTAPRLDLREAQDLRMVEARYSGVDRQHRPFVVTADVARQNPNANDIIALETPKGDMATASGGWFKITARTGLYQPQTQLLDLFGNVQLFQDKGNEFRTDSAHIDMANGTAEGRQAIEGEGPFGHAAGQGFRILDRGDTIIFTGQSHLELTPHEKAAK
ncbi:MAG TPA: LPS export ABC transporter periplasmic protein LptC [Stellaceae bacterium]